MTKIHLHLYKYIKVKAVGHI